MDKKRILLVALGGTISMKQSGNNGITPKLTGADLVETVPGLAEVADVEPFSPFQLPGASLTMDNLIEVVKLIDEKLAGPFEGAVVVQGTDTIEETAFVLDCLVQSERPVVVTGAMRGPAAAGADGPANILSAVSVAADSQAQRRGVLVVLNDEIHAAKYVRKGHSGLPSAFTSSNSGTLGNVFEGTSVFHASVTPMPKQELPNSGATPAVALVMVGLGDDGRFIDSLVDLGYKGAVIVAMGAGHVPQCLAEKIENLVTQMPVVLATRVSNGPVFTKTYGFPGSEMDLISKGVIVSGALGPVKSRLLLQILLALNTSQNKIGDKFCN